MAAPGVNHINGPCKPWQYSSFAMAHAFKFNQKAISGVFNSYANWSNQKCIALFWDTLIACLVIDPVVGRTAIQIKNAELQVFTDNKRASEPNDRSIYVCHTGSWHENYLSTQDSKLNVGQF